MLLKRLSEKMKILLIKAYSGRKYCDIVPPMGLMYLASYARSKINDIDIRIFDARLKGSRKENVLNEMIEKYGPDMVGISASSEDSQGMHSIARAVKSFDRKISVVAGGAHPSSYADDVVEDANIDIAVIGEGELTFYEIIEYALGRRGIDDIDGIVFRREGNTFRSRPRAYIEDLDSLPFPSWDLIDVEAYSRTNIIMMNPIMKGRLYMGMITSRGCPYNCVYCHDILGKVFRKRSAANVVAEIGALVDNYGVDEIHIYDDIFNFDGYRVDNICDMIVEYNLKVNIAFPNGIRGDIIEKKTLVNMKRAGVYMVTFALESASPRIQRFIKKDIDIVSLRENIIFSDSIGLITNCFFMLGFPGESYSELRETIRFALSSPLIFAAFFIVTPQKNTKLYDMAKEIFPGIEQEFDHSSYYYGKSRYYEKCCSKPLKLIQSYAFIRFYLDPARMLRLYRKVPRKEFLFNTNLLKFIKVITDSVLA